MKILPVTLLALFFSCNAFAQTSKYKPGFVFWMDGARTKATLIEQFRPIDEPGFKEMINSFKSTGDAKV